MPDLHGRAGQRLAVGVEHRALHEQDFALAIFAAVVQPRKAFAGRRTGHVQGTLDGARRAAAESCLCLGCIGADVQEALQAQSGGQQAKFLAAAGLGKVLDALPDFAGAQVQVFDGLEQIGGQADHHALHARVDLAVGGVDDERFDQRFDFRVSHLSAPCLWFSLWGPSCNGPPPRRCDSN